jgi:hypothetical protein
VPALGPDARSAGAATVTVPSTTPAGSYLLLACADDGKTVGEANEANNCRAAAARVEVR